MGGRARSGLRGLATVLVAVLVALSFATTLCRAAKPAEDGKGGTDEVIDFEQCDRDCRWVLPHGFYNRSIEGTRVDENGREDEWFGGHCACSRGGKPLGELVKRGTKKTWDEDFWCGNFSTSNVCAIDATTGAWHTTTRQQVDESGGDLRVLHCGACGACSSPSDMMVLWQTKDYITTKMTKCSIKFSMPKILGGTHNLDDLKRCLREENITFDDAVTFGKGGPTCMDCWTDNIECDAVHCKLECIRKFFDPTNDGKYEECLKCDETHCGPGFIRCAGANRRSVSSPCSYSSSLCFRCLSDTSLLSLPFL